jgi:hypothetical protein
MIFGMIDARLAVANAATNGTAPKNRGVSTRKTPAWEWEYLSNMHFILPKQRGGFGQEFCQ